tara:strand:+ start:191 stop:976 length:786 start_codon:yes stop_codon:yes gene_type:complete
MENNYFKKSLGQNFLIDKNIIKKILKMVKIKNKNVIEIGPGKGALTDEIIKLEPKKLILIEKDNDLVEKLRLRYCGDKRIKIINCDILKFDLENLLNKNFIIFGNLPYNISSQIIVKLIKLNWPPIFKNLVLMFQKELGEKILGKFSTSNYGRLSILSNYRLNIIDKFLVSPNSFFPKPKVNSLVIHFQPKKRTPFNIKNIESLEKVTNVLFSNKRKMINKSIKKLICSEKLKKIKDLELSYRPSEIKPEIYYKITELIEL